MADWGVLSNHGLVLVSIAREPSLRLREIAERVGITERTAHKIVDDLVGAGYVVRFREGNRNRYEIRHDVSIDEPLLENHWIGELLVILATESLARGSGRGPATEPAESEAKT
jgi:DNA-binding transcriptional ArsR family regulator